MTNMLLSMTSTTISDLKSNYFLKSKLWMEFFNIKFRNCFQDNVRISIHLEKITLQIRTISKTQGYRNVASITFRTNFSCNRYVSLQLDVVDLWYFKLRILLDPIVLWNIKGVSLHCKEIRIRNLSLWQNINSFIAIKQLKKNKY